MTDLRAASCYLLAYLLISPWIFLLEISWQDKWYEEMINNRNQSIVTDMAWDTQGQRICIAYEDGYVIVGGVGGTRLWGKELGLKLAKVCGTEDRITLASLSHP